MPAWMPEDEGRSRAGFLVFGRRSLARSQEFCPQFYIGQLIRLALIQNKRWYIGHFEPQQKSLSIERLIATSRVPVIRDIFCQSLYRKTRSLYREIIYLTGKRHFPGNHFQTTLSKTRLAWHHNCYINHVSRDTVIEFVIALKLSKKGEKMLKEANLERIEVMNKSEQGGVLGGYGCICATCSLCGTGAPEGNWFKDAFRTQRGLAI